MFRPSCLHASSVAGPASTLALIVLLTALGSVGCVRSVAARGTGWWRVTTEHVHLETDVEHDRAVTAGWAMEDLHRALTDAFPGCEGGSPEAPMDVVMIARGVEFDRLSDGYAPAFHRGSRVVLRAVSASRRAQVGRMSRSAYAQTFVHELTHRVVATCFPGAPAWLDEGLARFFETLRVREGELVLGIARYRFSGFGAPWPLGYTTDGVLAAWVGGAMLRPASVTLVSTSHDFYDVGAQPGPSAAASAWALVHLGMLGPDHEIRDDFAAYLAALHAGRGDAHWDTDPARLDAALRAYIGGGHLTERHLPDTPSPHADPAAIAMPEVEADGLLAVLEQRTPTTAPTRLMARLRVPAKPRLDTGRPGSSSMHSLLHP